MIITNDELRAFCTWYQAHFHTKQSARSVVVTCMCGYFHTYAKKAEELLKQCHNLGLIKIKENIIHLT